MGSFFTDLLSFDHEVAVYDIDPKRLRFMYNTQRFTSLDEIDAFEPELVINAVSLKYTLKVFDEVIPHLPKSCILSDISSVKTGFKEYYEASGFHYVSTHPMFGPTFANLGKLSDENAIIINEGDYMGRCFFKDLYQRLGLNIFEYTFEEHDQTVAYSLSIPFISEHPVLIIALAPGGFFVYALVIALVNWIITRKGGTPRDFSCQGCALAAMCTQEKCIAELGEIELAPAKPAAPKAAAPAANTVTKGAEA